VPGAEPTGGGADELDALYGGAGAPAAALTASASSPAAATEAVTAAVAAPAAALAEAALAEAAAAAATPTIAEGRAGYVEARAHPRERRRLDLAGKTYLAPLTTVRGFDMCCVYAIVCQRCHRHKAHPLYNTTTLAATYS
jgi:hypothetical protein